MKIKIIDSPVSVIKRDKEYIVSIEGVIDIDDDRGNILIYYVNKSYQAKDIEGVLMKIYQDIKSGNIRDERGSGYIIDLYDMNQIIIMNKKSPYSDDTKVIKISGEDIPRYIQGKYTLLKEY
jgi:hypothetical protein